MHGRYDLLGAACNAPHQSALPVICRIAKRISEETAVNAQFSRPIAALFYAVAMIAATMQSVPSALAGDTVHKIAIDVDDNDPKRMNIALNNVVNLKTYYESKGQKVQLEVVAYGPGLHMLRADTSPVKSRISTMALEIPDLQFSACGNTHRKMSKKAGKTVALLPEAKMVSSGVVRLVELQEAGYAYLRP
jgi:intracellular sulfur oxidation DsrE/DsrF family protein